MPALYEIILYLALILLPAAIASGFHISLQTLGRLQSKETIENKTYFPFLSFFKSLRPEQFWDSILFSVQLTKIFYYLIFGFVSFYFLFIHDAYEHTQHIQQLKTFSFYISSLLEIALILSISLCIELISTLLIEKNPGKASKILSFPTCVLMTPCFPFILCYTKLKQFITPPPQSTQKLPPELKEKLQEYLNQSELGRYLEKNEIKLIQTVISFKDRIVREVMVPRIDVFSLSSDTSIKEATRYFSLEGYSRIPVYKENVDKIIGILLYKDILSIYTKHIENHESEAALEKTIEHLVKPALYTPETKKIALLLQEFRNKQTHLAIVVDEYGGTEGIVTIEDILEELVGEIEDEHDTQEEKIYTPLSSGGWIVDAKMSIIDLEEDLGVKVPHSIEYDTIGGYVFHKTGSIPGIGSKIHLDDVDLEILASDPRSIQKIKITQRSHKSRK